MNRAKHYCEYWQAQLGLQDWDIDIVLVDPVNEYGDFVYGQMHWDLNSKTGLMEISAVEQGYQPSKGWLPFEVENVVCHELWHVATARIMVGSTAKEIEEEQFMNHMAAMCVRLRKGDDE